MMPIAVHLQQRVLSLWQKHKDSLVLCEIKLPSSLNVRETNRWKLACLGHLS